MVLLVRDFCSVSSADLISPSCSLENSPPREETIAIDSLPDLPRAFMDKVISSNTDLISSSFISLMFSRYELTTGLDISAFSLFTTDSCAFIASSTLSVAHPLPSISTNDVDVPFARTSL